jgi:hypothetical protein
MSRPMKPTGRPRARPGGVIRVTIELSAEYEPAAYYYLASSADPYRDTIARALECLASSEKHPAITADGQAQIEQNLADRAAPKPARRSVQPAGAPKAPTPRQHKTAVEESLQRPVEPAFAPAPLLKPIPAQVPIQAPAPAPAPEEQVYVAPAPLVNPAAWHEDPPSTSPQPESGFEKPAFLGGRKK